MKIKSLFVVMFLIQLASTSFSQDIWTLEQCIDYAYENNIQVKQQELNTQFQRNTLNQSYWNILPSVNGSGSNSFSSGRSVDPYTYEFTEDNITSYNFSVGSSVTLFSGLQKWNTIAANKFSLLAGLQDELKLKNDIALNISAAYLQILFSEELVIVAESQLEITKQQVARTKILVDAGSLPEGSLLEVQAQEANEEVQVINTQNQLDFSYLTLTQFLELESGISFQIAKPKINIIDKTKVLQSVNSIFEEAINSLPQIKSAEYSLKNAEKNLKVAKGAYLPRLSANASIYTGYSNKRFLYSIEEQSYPAQLIGHTINGTDVLSLPGVSYIPVSEDYQFADQLNDNAYKSLSFNLSIPIFNQMQVRNSVKNSKLNLISSKYTLDATKNQLYKEIQQAHADAIAAFKKYIASEKSLAATEESFRYTQQKFDVGLVNIVDFNLAKNQFLRVQSDMLQSKYEYIFKSNILQFYRGKPISY